MEHCVHQNNAINIYELYFSEYEDSEMGGQNNFKTVNVFRDMCTTKRPVANISWSPDQGSRLAVTHANLNFQKETNDNFNHSYIWHIGALLPVYPYYDHNFLCWESTPAA